MSHHDMIIITLLITNFASCAYHVYSNHKTEEEHAQELFRAKSKGFAEGANFARWYKH